MEQNQNELLQTPQPIETPQDVTAAEGANQEPEVIATPEMPAEPAQDVPVTIDPPAPAAYEAPQAPVEHQAPQAPVEYQAPEAPVAYQAPDAQPVYQAPEAPAAYQASDAQPVYQAPDAQPVYQAPDAQPVYQAPDAQSAYQAPNAQAAYQAPPENNWNAAAAPPTQKASGEKKPINKLALIGFCLSVASWAFNFFTLCLMSVAGIVVSVLALKRMDKEKENYPWMPMAGIAVGAFATLVDAIIIISVLAVVGIPAIMVALGMS